MAPKQSINPRTNGNSNASTARKTPKKRETTHKDRVKKTQKHTQKQDKVVVIAKQSGGDEDRDADLGLAKDKPFRFLDLPGELRNKIYKLTTFSAKQALLIHLPRRGTLRPRRSAPSYKDSEFDSDSNTKKNKKNREERDVLKRESARPFFGLTQVCRQIRVEYRPMYLLAQETGLDFTSLQTFISAFYPPHPSSESNLAVGNLTIALSYTLKPCELGPRGTNIYPLLDTWANSYRIEAGFGRYHNSGPSAAYNAETDGEAKDLYRLFGRKVLRNKQCGPMNQAWRRVLRGRKLVEVRVCRDPASLSLQPDSLPLLGGVSTAIPTPTPNPNPTAAQITAMFDAAIAALRAPKPYFHILFKAECAEHWMQSEDSQVPRSWLVEHGFDGMEYFAVKVGVLRDPAAEAAQQV